MSEDPEEAREARERSVFSEWAKEWAISEKTKKGNEEKMKCKICGVKHAKSTHPHYKLAASLNDEGFPTHENRYLAAHKVANKAEEKAYGRKQFKELERIDRKLSKHELSGKNLRTGKLEVSKKVPKKLREEVAYHEEVENKVLRRKK